MITLKLPPAFRTDRAERELPIGTDIGGGFVTLIDDAAAEYLNDAEFYADKWGPEVDGGLRHSARRTVAAFRKAGR